MHNYLHLYALISADKAGEIKEGKKCTKFRLPPAGSLMCFYNREKQGKDELQLREKEDVFNWMLC